jgi:nitrile hydratase
MNGIHDVGGMDGFGSLATDGADHDPDGEISGDGGDEGNGGDADGESLAGEVYDPFHERWEGITYGLFVATLGNGIANIDEFRHSIERMDPKRYLAASYYDRWVIGLSRLLLETDTVDPEDFWVRTAAFEAGDASVPERSESGLIGDLVAGVADAYGSEHEPQDPRFEGGEEVRVRNHHPAGHTRCPRYARRARGVVESHRGTFTLPDANAHGESTAEPLYEVAFDGRELWGEEADPNVTVTLDLWESYLSPAAPEMDGDPSDDADDTDGTDGTDGAKGTGEAGDQAADNDR